MPLKYIPIAFLVILSSCAANPKKDPEITRWKTDAYKTLNAFKKADAEIKEFDQQFGFKQEKDSSGNIFLMLKDIERIEKDTSFNFTETKKWFNLSLSVIDYISYKNGKITAQYDHLYLIPYDYEVALYYSTTGGPEEYHRNKISQLYDSLSLGNDWYYIVTRCNGCGD